MHDEILHGLAKKGYAARIVSIDRLEDLRETFEAGHRNGLYDEELYKTYLNRFTFSLPANMPDARSIVIMAAKQPQYSFTFAVEGKKFRALVPPTFLHSEAVDREMLEALQAAVAGDGRRVAPVRLPLKLLAVRSGLASYGRNNITYVPGMGSFQTLAAFLTTVPGDERDEWHELKMAERCKDCRVCSRQCPTGAIAADRFQLYAEKCLVFHNEKPSRVPFPAWIDGVWHNSLVGCMRCQNTCPLNKDFTGFSLEDVTFTEEETALLLADTPKDQLSSPLLAKLERSDLLSWSGVLSRNLRALVTQMAGV